MLNSIGVMFGATEDLEATLSEFEEIGIREGQMAVPGDLSLGEATEQWRVLPERRKFRIHTLFGVYTDESYADIETVRRTVGFIPRAMRRERELRSREIIDLAASMGVPGFATHVGFIPENDRDEDYIAVREMVRRLADHAASRGMTFALETGQETAENLRNFLIDVNRGNVGVNFDPANMILYGTGDPIEALKTVGQHVITVHAKDGIWPAAGEPGCLGVETPIGEGKVNFPDFLSELEHIGHRRPLFIERETNDHSARLRDIAAGKKYIEDLQKETPSDKRDGR